MLLLKLSHVYSAHELPPSSDFQIFKFWDSESYHKISGVFNAELQCLPLVCVDKAAMRNLIGLKQIDIPGIECASVSVVFTPFSYAPEMSYSNYCMYIIKCTMWQVIASILCSISFMDKDLNNINIILYYVMMRLKSLSV